MSSGGEGGITPARRPYPSIIIITIIAGVISFLCTVFAVSFDMRRDITHPWPSLSV